MDDAFTAERGLDPVQLRKEFGWPKRCRNLDGSVQVIGLRWAHRWILMEPGRARNRNTARSIQLLDGLVVVVFAVTDIGAESDVDDGGHYGDGGRLMVEGGTIRRN